MNDKRRHERIAFPSEVKVMHPDFPSLIGRTRDISDGGVYLFLDIKPGLRAGTQVTLQALDTSAEAPLVRATVVRVEADGIALMFHSD